MLEFNPDKRISAKDALSSPLFDSIRKADLERTSTSQVKLLIDEPGMFDYEKGISHYLQAEHFRALILD